MVLENQEAFGQSQAQIPLSNLPNILAGVAHYRYEFFALAPCSEPQGNRWAANAGAGPSTDWPTAWPNGYFVKIVFPRSNVLNGESSVASGVA